MAEQIVSHVLTKLGELLIKEYFFLRGVKGQVEYVKIHLRQMQSFLRDAEERRVKGDNRTEQWVRDIRDVAFETEDAIDTYIVKMHNAMQRHVLGRRYAVKIAALHNLGNKISAIQEKIRTISESRINLGIKNLGEALGELSLPPQKPIVYDIDNTEIVGFEVDRENIINALTNNANNSKRLVVSIVGPGGLGKTTIAQKTYNDPRVKESFDLCIWVSISQDFKPIDVLRKLCGQATGNDQITIEEAGMHLGELNKSLSKKRYLIVLDDVWTYDVFDYLNGGFPGVGNGSRVIITTRSVDVAPDREGVFELPFLLKEQTLELLLKNALQIPDPLMNCPNELRDVAKKLANRCGGLPLAVVVLGRLLSKKPCNQANWSQVEKNLDWYRDGQNCMNILASSYHDLPYYLKACFRYLACFPEDHAIYAQDVIRLWVAEGFMGHAKGTLEDEAERCLEDLAQRSLIQVVERNYDGSIVFFKVHDLLRDLAIHESKENDFLFICNKENTQTDFNRARRVVIHETGSENNPLENITMPNVRSFLSFDDNVQIGITYPLLRVLELEGNSNLKKLPIELKGMVHLRYLGMDDTRLFQLPETIGCLQNLQTLRISGTKVCEIPSSLWTIQTLRHLIANNLPEILPRPPPIANLPNLQTLLNFLVPKTWEDKPPCLTGLRCLHLTYPANFNIVDINGNPLMPNWNVVISLLGTLNYLVRLEIKGHNIPVVLANFNNYPSHPNLKFLRLKGSDERSSPPFSTRFNLGLVEMPRNVVKLELTRMWFDKDPMPKLEILPCLKYLELMSIENVEEMICSTGGFPQLLYLAIWDWYDLKHWKVEEKAMPLLKNLDVRNCLKLLSIHNLQHVKTLQWFHLISVPDELKNKLKDKDGEEWKQIQHIPKVIIH